MNEMPKEIKREIMLEVAKWIVKFDVDSMTPEEKFRLAKRKYDEIETRMKLEELTKSLNLIKENDKPKEVVKDTREYFPSRRSKSSIK